MTFKRSFSMSLGFASMSLLGLILGFVPYFVLLTSWLLCFRSSALHSVTVFWTSSKPPLHQASIGSCPSLPTFHTRSGASTSLFYAKASTISSTLALAPTLITTEFGPASYNINALQLNPFVSEVQRMKDIPKFPARCLLGATFLPQHTYQSSGPLWWPSRLPFTSSSGPCGIPPQRMASPIVPGLERTFNGRASAVTIYSSKGSSMVSTISLLPLNNLSIWLLSPMKDARFSGERTTASSASARIPSTSPLILHMIGKIKINSSPGIGSLLRPRSFTVLPAISVVLANRN